MIFEQLFAYVLKRKFLYQAIATLSVYLILSVARFYYIRRRRFKLLQYFRIPGPKPNLSDGNYSIYLHTPFNAQVDEELCKKYGKVFGVFLGDEPTLVINDAEIIRRIFLEEQTSFRERCYPTVTGSPLSQSLILSRYNRWKRMRRELAPGFTKYTIRNNRYNQFMESSVKEMLEYLEQRLTEIKSKTERDFIDLRGLFKATALHVINETAIKLPNVHVMENEPNVEDLDVVIEYFGGPLHAFSLRFPFIRRILDLLSRLSTFNKTMTAIVESVDREIDNSKRKLGNSDRSNHSIDDWVELHHKGHLTRDEVVSFGLEILTAGYTTTASTLTYIFWALAKHTEIQEKLRGQLMAHGVESEYLKQVIFETMRLYPTAPLLCTRLATKTVKVGDLVIPQGCRVVYNSWLLQRSPDLWPEPLNFDPERFRPGVEIHPCAFAPFGLGHKKCIGYEFALMDMKTIISQTLLRYRLKLIAPQELKLATYLAVLTQPRDEVMLDFEKL